MRSCDRVRFSLLEQQRIVGSGQQPDQNRSIGQMLRYAGVEDESTSSRSSRRHANSPTVVKSPISEMLPKSG